jgi:predicted outer membrane protein
MKTITGAIAAVLLATVVGASTGPIAAQQVPASVADQAFVFSVLQEARGQIAFARFAEPRAQSVAVGRLASTTLDEWSALAARLEAVAQANGEPTPVDLTPAQQRILAELRQTHTEDFDAAYVRVAETDFERVLEAFRDAAGSADPQIAGTVEAARPTFERLDRQTNEDPALPGTF